jgi:hypothetical protein
MTNRMNVLLVLLLCLALFGACASTADQNTSDAAGALTQVPRTCAPLQCGAQPGMRNFLCSDGITLAGPSSRCLRNLDGSCGWEAISCPATVCTSSAKCSTDQYCTTEIGVCNPPPGCIPGKACATVCYGTCLGNTQ